MRNIIAKDIDGVKKKKKKKSEREKKRRVQISKRQLLGR